MSQYKWFTGDLITADRLNANSFNLLTGVAGYEAPITLADNVQGTFLIKPTVDPAASTRLFEVQNAAGQDVFYVSADGGFASAGNPTFIRFDAETLVAPATSITLTVGASPRTHLRLIGYAAFDAGFGGAANFLGIQFNGDATVGHYDTVFTLASSGAVTALSETARAEFLVGYIPNISDLANNFGAYVFDIPSYTNTTNKKTIVGSWGYKSANAVHIVGPLQGNAAGTWDSAAAITSVTIFNASGGGDLVAGTNWTLLGIP